MYYKENFSNHHVDNSFKNNLRDNVVGAHQIRKNLVQNYNTPTKKCLNISLKSSRAFEYNYKKQLPLDINNNSNSNVNNTNTPNTVKHQKNKSTIDKLKTNIDMFISNSKKIRNTKTNNDIHNNTITNFTNDNHYLNSNNKKQANNSFQVSDTKLLNGRTPSNAKMLSFFYGNNPIEVLSDKKASSLLENEKSRIQKRSKEVKSFMDSSGVKKSLINFNIDQTCGVFNKTSKITSTPKSLIDNMTIKPKYTKKQNVIGVDNKNHKCFYMN